MAEVFDYQGWDDKLGEDLPVMEEVFDYGLLLLTEHSFTEGKVRLILEDEDDEIDLFKAREMLESLYEECEAGIRSAPEREIKLLQESGRIENMKAYTGTPYDYSVEKTMGLQYLFLDKTVWARRLGAIGRW